MSDNKHNLDEGNAEYFQFILKGNTYRMRYPTAQEIKDIAAEKDQAIQEQKIYSFIEAVTENAPEIKDVINQLPINVITRFNKMVMDEFVGSS